MERTCHRDVVMCVPVHSFRDVQIIVVGRLLAVLPIISMGQLLRWYWPIVVYAIGKCSFWVTVKRFALSYQIVVCPVLSSLSLTLVYCGQTVGCIKMKLGM